MPEKILDIEQDASNKEIYKIVPGEEQGKRSYRIDKIKKDIDKRLKDLSDYTGVLRFNIDVENLRRRALLKLLEKKGLAETAEFEDIYFLLVDLELREMDKNKDKIKKARIDKMMTSTGKKLLVPGQGFSKNVQTTEIGDELAARRTSN